MVIINTRAVDVSIQAVSPELTSENFAMNGAVGAGAAGAAAGADVEAGAVWAAAGAASELVDAGAGEDAGGVVSWSADAVNGTADSASQQDTSNALRTRAPVVLLSFETICMTGLSRSLSFQNL